MKHVLNLKIDEPPKVRPRIVEECAYKYRDENGDLVFEHVRWKTNDHRGKTFSYRYPHPSGVGWEKGKPDGADNYLWLVPTILEHPREEWWWTEGEKDAVTLLEGTDVLATSHHAGAGHTSLAQARWLKRAGRLVLAVDKDVDGAHCAARRYTWLVDKLGVPADRVRLVYARGKGNKDISDHLAAGYGLGELRTMPIEKCRAVARKYSAATAARSGYIYVGRVAH